MNAFLRYADAKKEEIIGTIRSMVECESPTDAPQDVNRYVEMLVEISRDIATPKLTKSKVYGSHLRLDFKVSGVKKAGRILGLGHSDTVWPLGTLKCMPYRRAKGRLWGPGVLDMKSGIAFFLYAVRACRDLDVAISRRVSLLVVSDEEMGSKDSRALTESEARKSSHVLVLEPGTGLAGHLKTARKGIAAYRLSVQGKSAHAGVDFENGASAIVELAHQIGTIAGLTNTSRGLTVNPGFVSGGTRTNVIAAEAHVDMDVRVAKATDAAWIDRRIKKLKAFDKRCVLSISGGLNRPPMERSKSTADLFRMAQQIGSEMRVDVRESSTGGGSDGNFTAALGIPTLDGLGGVGEGAHAINESILVDRIADRTALLAGLLSRL
jgi:glutamate carboxypeptidase